MHRQVAAVLGLGERRQRIRERLPRGGALVVLSAQERELVLSLIVGLEEAIEQAAQVLEKPGMPTGAPWQQP